MTLPNKFQHKIKTIIDLLLPHQCIVCSKPTFSNDLYCCELCFDQLPFQQNACSVCGQQFNAQSDTCGQCISNPPEFESCFCAFTYQNPIRELIQSFKYKQQPALATLLGRLLYQEIYDQQLELPDALIPVPMHFSRLGERGYNQAQLLATEVGKLSNIKVDNHLIKKTTITPTQASLSRKQRIRSIKGSFVATQNTPYSNVAIIDDVVTTGATISEITKILKEKGVDSIQVWAIAHTN